MEYRCSGHTRTVMKPISPWSVKGVDDDARELARNAAQAAGLTLGAWIDRAIKISTGLAPEESKFALSTTVSTTLTDESPDDRGEYFGVDDRITPDADEVSEDRGQNIEAAEAATSVAQESTNHHGVISEVSVSATPDMQESSDVQGARVEVDEPSTLNTSASPLAQGIDETPTESFDAGEQHPAYAPITIGLQVDPEERFEATVETVDTPEPRRWPSAASLFGAGVPRIAISAAAIVIAAGVLVYGVGFTGSDDQDPSASTSEGMATSATTTPAPPATERARHDDTPPPLEPGVIEMLTAAAEQGDAIAQHDLAARYLDGKTVTRNLELAKKWLERAASQGMASAQHRLGVMYDDGTGVKADRNRAAMWHTRAASQGHPASQHALALAYTTGRGVKQSEASATVWLQRAALAGNAESQVLLAGRYQTGRGIERNAAKAAELYASAAAKGHAGAVARAEKLAARAAAKPAAPEKSALAAKPALPPAAPALPADMLLDKAGIAEVQRLLARLAFKPGPADGVLGRRTVREIKLYQSFAGLPDDGKATTGLLHELREMVRGMPSETSPSR